MMDDDMKRLAQWILKRHNIFFGRMDALEDKKHPDANGMIQMLSGRQHELMAVIDKIKDITAIDYMLDDE